MRKNWTPRDWRQLAALLTVLLVLAGAIGAAVRREHTLSQIPPRLTKVEVRLEQVTAIQQESFDDRQDLRRQGEDMMAVLCYIVERQYGTAHMLTGCVKLRAGGGLRE